MEKDSAIQLALKRKWQIALRRYLFENHPSIDYAGYFALPSPEFKAWIESQFTEGMNWENFGKEWNLTQRLPAHLFDLTDKSDLALCWHFLNIAVQDLKEESSTQTLELLATRKHLEALYKTTNLPKVQEMLNRLTIMEEVGSQISASSKEFLRNLAPKLEKMKEFEGEDFARLNKGEELDVLLMEKDIIKKYGS